MLGRLVLAVVVGVFVTIVLVLVGALLVLLEVNFAVVIGEWIEKYAALLGFLAALWYFFSGTTWGKNLFNKQP